MYLLPEGEGLQTDPPQHMDWLWTRANTNKRTGSRCWGDPHQSHLQTRCLADSMASSPQVLLSQRETYNTADLVNLQRVVLNQESEHGSTSWRALVSASLPVTAHLKGTNILIPKPTGKVCLLLCFTWGPSLWLAHLYITSWIFLKRTIPGLFFPP